MKQTKRYIRKSIKELFRETVTEEPAKEKALNIVLALLVTIALAFYYDEVGYGRGWPYAAVLHNFVGAFSDYCTH